MKKLILLLLLIPGLSLAAGKWECIDNYVLCHTWRMKTPDGWIVSGENSEEKYAMTYVPDVDHKWQP